jgi:hypothetical protein
MEEQGMDLRIYYQKIREVEGKIAGDCAVVMSLQTADGGKGGTMTEVPRRLAAKLVVEGQARLASREESESFRASQAEAKRRADQIAAAARVQVAVLSSAEFEKLRGAGKPRG